jgi:hypothetical protein
MTPMDPVPTTSPEVKPQAMRALVCVAQLPLGVPHTDKTQRGFYIAIAAIPTFYLSYQVATNPNNFVGRFVEGFASVKDKAEGRATSIHDAAMQQAISDRLLLKGTPRNASGPSIRYQE